MSLFEAALQEMQSNILTELEERIWQRLASRIEQALHCRHMSIAQTAEYLHVSEQTARRMIASRELPHFRVRGQIFIRQTDVDEWIQNQIDGN